ncbi:MAG TPA: VWA-like domain-containing protein [Polyangiaceae bacterium]|nr:VWA-like domain-containing protein [Polyangiaceae bacterium]
MPGKADPAGAPAPSASGAVDKIAAARVWLLKEKPFFGVLSRALSIAPGSDVPAFRLRSNDTLAVNPSVVLRMSFAALTARLAHLALHAALGGFVRRGERDPRRWNLAHDLAIDPLVRGAGLALTLPPPPDDLPRGASAEEIFDVLPEGAGPVVEWCDLCDPASEPPEGDLARQTGPRPPFAETEVGPSNVDEQARALAWKMRLATALQEERASGGKTWGDVPAWIDEMIRAVIEPPPSWTVILQRSVSSLTRTDRTWLRPSRRMSAIAHDTGGWPDVVAMPGRKVVLAGQLVAVVDTSGSIDDATLSRFLGAVASAAAAEGIEEVRLMQADSEVTSDEVMTPAELLAEPVAIRGRGGTSFVPALSKLIDEAQRKVERFSVVYLTDLEGMLPSTRSARSLDVLWVVPRTIQRKPPFGVVVQMPPR